MLTLRHLRSNFVFLRLGRSAVLVLPFEDLAHLLVPLQLVLVTVVAEGTAPTVQIVVH